MEQRIPPSARRIRIEADGQTLACVERCQIASKRELHPCEALGQQLRLAPGDTLYTLELRRVRLSAGLPDLHSARRFTVVIEDGQRRTVYTGCEWSALTEELTVGEQWIDTMTLTAVERKEEIV